MIKELLSVYTNLRFWSFMLVAFMPIWGCLIAGGYVLIKEKIDEVLQRR